MGRSQPSPLVCFSHLRWDFVLQRPQHLMTRFARKRQVFFFEEPTPTEHHRPYLEFHFFEDARVTAVRPRMPREFTGARLREALAILLDQLLQVHGGGGRPLLWFYTPMMYSFACHIDAEAVVYDCMDELSNFRFAPPELRTAEGLLLERADVVFTGGYSIFEAKRDRHRNIHPFPSSVDVAHFAQARRRQAVPADQTDLTSPVLGYYGVIDERLDLGLIAALAKGRPDWSFVMAGPVVKIDEAELPKADTPATSVARITQTSRPVSPVGTWR